MAVLDFSIDKFNIAIKVVARHAETAYFPGELMRATRQAAGDVTMRLENNHAGEQMLVKLYAKRRLYRPDLMRHLTALDLVGMAQRGEAFRVIDAVTGDDVTPLFRPIIVEH